MEPHGSSPEQSRPRKSSEKKADLRQENPERNKQIGGMLFGELLNEKKSEAANKVAEEKKKKRRQEKKKPPVVAPENKPSEASQTPESTEPAKPETEEKGKVISLVERLKAVRREQAVITEVESAQPEVQRARSLARKIIDKITRESPPAPQHEPKTDRKNWRAIIIPQRRTPDGVQELVQVVAQGERVDAQVQSAVRERHLKLVPPLESAETDGDSAPSTLHVKWRQAMFPSAGAAVAGTVLAGGGGAMVARGAEMASTAAATAGEVVVNANLMRPRVDHSTLVFGGAALFVAGLFVGRRRGERRAEKRHDAEKTVLNQQIKAAEAESRELQDELQHELQNQTTTPQSSEKIEQIIKREVATQQSITAEQNQRIEKLQSLDNAAGLAVVTPGVGLNSASNSTSSISPNTAPNMAANFKLPTSPEFHAQPNFAARPEIVAPLAASAANIERRAAPNLAQTSTESVPKPETQSSTKTSPEIEAPTTRPMNEYEMKPIILARLERITGNRKNAEHVYELLKSSHSNPAEILALTPEKLKSKADDALKRDAARLVLAKTLRPADTPTNELDTAINQHELMQELYKKPAVLSPKEFLLKPSKERDRALFVAAGITVGVVIIFIVFT